MRSDDTEAWVERRLAGPSFESRFRIVAPHVAPPVAFSRGPPRWARSASLRERLAPFEFPPDIGRPASSRLPKYGGVWTTADRRRAIVSW